ncbi:MAG: hypothetical protein ACYDHY_09425 [Acidiferrobacterales bacterium]
MKKIIVAVALMMASGLVFANGFGSNQYNNGLSQENVILGRVISMQTVQGQPNGHANAGGIVGMIAGAALGNQAGHGAGRTIATAVGGILGGLVGSHVENSAETAPATQVTVQLSTGQIIAVVERGQDLHLDQKVQVIYSTSGGGWGQPQQQKVRVMPL